MNNEPGVTLVTYMGGRPNTQEWRGRESHTTYRFSSSPSNKTKWVFDADVPHLLALMDGGQTIFATVPQELQSPVKIEEEAPGDPEPAMVALGPPVEHDAATITRMAYAKAVEEGLGKGPMLIDEDDNPGDVPPTDIGAMFGDPDDPADKVTGDSLSTRELRLLVPEMSIEEVSGHLAKEKAGPNRSTAVTLLERRMKQLTGG